MYTIKNLLSILIKLIGLIFILISCVYVIPGYIFYWNDNILEENKILGLNIPINIALLTGDIIVNLIIYFLFIYKTDLIIKFLNIKNHLEKEIIDKNFLSVNKLAQIGIVIASIFIFILSFPEFIINIVIIYNNNDEYDLLQNIDLIQNVILILVSILFLIYNDKIAKFLTK